jgi:hypothetical protein
MLLLLMMGILKSVHGVREALRLIPNRRIRRFRATTAEIQIKDVINQFVTGFFAPNFPCSLMALRILFFTECTPKNKRNG